ncbi:Efflux pump radE [Lachnellula arida]|uniref:Efflux pump radE n=1 Tax=Lachnellula arida TaxID=1316785 RepID=A0A8T9BE61_9HELO|nr:Efflux pump radE [Lachnellula arida]
MELMAMLATVICAPVAPQILEDFHSDSSLYRTLLVSIWELGEVIGPFLIAPLSELYGRFYIYHGGNILFVLFSIGGALSTNIHMLIAFRFLNGIAVMAVVLNPSIIGDIYVVEQRGAAMAITGIAPLIGPVVGPIVGSYLGQAAGWRWVFWLVAILCGSIEILFILFFRETYKGKGKEVAEDHTRPDLKSKYDTESASKAFREAILRPAEMLIFSPMLVILSLYVAVVYGYMYLIMTTLTEVFENNYGFSEGAAGLAFLGFTVGFIFGVFLCHFTLDLWVARYAAVGSAKPEYRLPPVAFGGIIIPLGLFMYGWTVEEDVHWMAPIVATGILGAGLLATMIPASSYIVDAFGIHAASAMAGSLVLRNVAGTFFPLAGPPLYNRLQYGWGNSLLGFIALAFVPVPLLMMKYGERLRSLDKRKIEF